jgi:sulfur relay (sulfurtransferase) DsrF/TusC family protein
VEGVPSSSTENFQIVNGNAANSTTRLNHYVFFIKEATFECLAESYSENISYKI